ncbi:MAG: RND family transporter [Acidiferrobacterales bacterium]
MLDAYTDWLLRWHKAIVIVVLAVVVLLSAGAFRLTITNDMRAYFSPDNPQLAAFDALENVFNKQDDVFLFVVPRSRDIFNAHVLTLVWELTEFGWQSPYSTRVSSLANHQHTHAKGDELFVVDLIADPKKLDAAAIASIKRISLNDPTLVGTLVAADGSATGIEITLAMPPANLNANDEIVEFFRSRLPEFRARYPEVEILLGGSAAMNVTLGEAVEQDLRNLIALSYLIIIVGLLLFLRQLGGTVAAVLVVTMAIACTMGLFGWFGVVLEAVAGFVPSVVMTIAVADSVHILVSYYYERRRGQRNEAAIRESLRINAAPVLITSITTIIGMLTLNFSDSPPYRDLGNMVAVGVCVAYGLSMSFLPALLAWMSVGNVARGQSLEASMRVFADWVIRRHKALLVGMSVSIIILASFIPRNQLTERWHDYFDDTFEIRNTIETVNDKLGGVHAIRYGLDTGVDQGINEPAYLAAVDRFADWYRRQPGVSHVTKITDVIKRLNMNMHGDDPEWYRLPQSRELAAQYLLLYELSLPQGLGLENIINVSRSATQFTVAIEKTDSERLIELDRRAQAWLRAHAPDIRVAEGTGLDMVFAHINHRNIRALLAGVALALVLISLLLIVALRSVKLGLMSLVTNLAPAGLAYGTWGLFVGWIDLSASVVMCMSLGIVVDDTVHFVSKYLRARREQRLSAAEGMRYAFNTVGVALCITSAVLVAGFLVLGASHFSPTWTTGILIAITLSYALVIDFLFLPPLLLVLDQRWHIRF